MEAPHFLHFRMARLDRRPAMARWWRTARLDRRLAMEPSWRMARLDRRPAMERSWRTVRLDRRPATVRSPHSYLFSIIISGFSADNWLRAR